MWADDLSVMILEEFVERSHVPHTGMTESWGNYQYVTDERWKEYDASVTAQHEARIALSGSAKSRCTNWVAPVRDCSRCGLKFVPRWPSQKHCDAIACVCRQ